MQEMEKPASRMREPALNQVEQLAGGLNQNDIRSLTEFQANRLTRLFFLCRATAHTIANLAFAGGPR